MPPSIQPPANAGFIGGKFSVIYRYAAIYPAARECGVHWRQVLRLFPLIPVIYRYAAIYPAARECGEHRRQETVRQAAAHNVARLPRFCFLASGEHCFFSPQKVEKFFLCATLFL